MVQVADLVANFRATGLDDIGRGAQQAREQLRGVASEAQATAAQLDELARRAAAANPNLGSAQSFRTVFERQNLSYANAAEMLGGVAKNAEQAATAVQKIAQPTQAAAKAATDLHEGFKLSESSAIRFGTSLVGVGLGISLVAGAGRVLHDVIDGVVQRQLEWERSLVQVRALYGDISPRIVALSQQQAALPGVTASPAELLQSNVAAQFLTTRYGLSPTLTGRLTTQAARLGGLLYPGDAAQQRALRDAFLQYGESGGDALRGSLNLAGDPTFIAQQIGLRSGAALGGFTPQQLTEIQTQLAIRAGAQANLQGNTEQRGLLDAQRELQHNLEQAQAGLQQRLEGTPDDARLRGLITSQEPRNVLEAEQQQQQLAELDARQQSYADAVQRAQQAIEANSAAVADNQRQFEESSDFLRKRGVQAGTATARALDFFGTLEDPFSVASYDVVARAQGAIAGRRSAIPGIGTPSAEIAFQASNQAAQDALQNMIARQAQRVELNQTRERLEEQANQIGPGLEQSRADARSALEEARQTDPVQRQLGDAQLRARQLDFQAAEQQSRIESITLTQRERNLRMLQDTVELRREDVKLQMHGVEANQALIRAQQAAQGPQNALEAAQYQTTRASVLAQARMARLLQGKDVSGLPSFDELIAMNIQGQFAAAEAGPAALEAGRGVQVAGQAVTAASLAQQFTQSQVQLAELAVDLQNLGELPGQTALELELLQTNRDQLDVSREQRDLTRQLVAIMGGSPGASNGVTAQQISEGLAATSNAMAPASSGLAGARR